MSQSIISQLSGFEAFEVLTAFETHLSQAISFNIVEPKTLSDKAGNIFKSVFSAVDNLGVTAVQKLYSYADEKAGRPVSQDSATGKEVYNIAGILANGAAGFLSVLVRVASIALAALAAAGAVIFRTPYEFVMERLEARNHTVPVAETPAAVLPVNIVDEADVARRELNIQKILVQLSVNGSGSRQAIENALKFIEELVPTPRNADGTEIVTGLKKDEETARIAREALNGKLAQMDAEYQASFKGRAAALANRVAANPYLNNRLVKGVAVLGLGAATLYGASYLPVVGPVICDTSSRIASYISSLNPFAKTVSQPMCPLPETFEQAICTLADKPVQPVCTMADKAAAELAEKVASQAVCTLADKPLMSPVPDAMSFAERVFTMAPKAALPVCTEADKVGAQVLEVAEAAAAQVLGNADKVAKQVLENASETAAKVLAQANETATKVLLDAGSKAAASPASPSFVATAIPSLGNPFTAVVNFLDQIRIVISGVLIAGFLLGYGGQQAPRRRPPILH